MIGVVVGLGVTVPAAIAKVWFVDMGSKRLHWDQRVATTISNCPGNDSCTSNVRGLWVYLARGTASIRPGSEVSRRGLHRLARIDATGTLRFRVPHVTGRRYLVVLRTAGRSRQYAPVSNSFRITR